MRRHIPAWRRALTTFEVVATCSVMVAVMGFVAPLVARNTRLLDGCRDYRIALDELSNQLDRLTHLPAEGLDRAIAELEPSPLATRHLPDAELTAQRSSDDDQTRIRLALSWRTEAGRRPPLVLVGWTPREEKP